MNTVQFLGICVFDVTGSAATAYFPNASAGTSTIPPHHASIVVSPNSVDFSGWGSSPQVGTIPPLGAGTFWKFDLNGVDLSFSPTPPAGASNLNLLLHILHATAAFCPNLKQLKQALNTPAVISARIAVAGGLNAFKQANGLAFTKLDVADNVVITATPLGGGQSKILKVTSATEIKLVNIDVSAVAGHDDTPHLGLYCKVLDPIVSPVSAGGSRAAADVSVLRFAALRDAADAMLRFFLHPGTHHNEHTLGPGCSNTQWP